MMDSDFRNLIRRFYELQAERVETYRMFEDCQTFNQATSIVKLQKSRQHNSVCASMELQGLNYFAFRGHQAYLKSGPHYDFVRYRQLVHEITLAFNGISKEVIQIKDRFREVYDRSDLSEHLEKIQEMEKEKLELTARLQIAKQNAQDHPSQELHQEEVQILRHKIIKSVEAISEVLQDFKYDCEEIQ